MFVERPRENALCSGFRERKRERREVKLGERAVAVCVWPCLCYEDELAVAITLVAVYSRRTPRTKPRTPRLGCHSRALPATAVFSFIFLNEAGTHNTRACLLCANERPYEFRRNVLVATYSTGKRFHSRLILPNHTRRSATDMSLAPHTLLLDVTSLSREKRVSTL